MYSLLSFHSFTDEKQSSRSTRSRAAIDTRNDLPRVSAPVSLDSALAHIKPRYNNSTIPLRDDSSYNHRSRQAGMKNPKSVSRTLKPLPSLSNMFEDSEKARQVRNGKLYPSTRTSDREEQKSLPKLRSGRLRSLSDTSLYRNVGSQPLEDAPNHSPQHFTYDRLAHYQVSNGTYDEESVEYVNEEEEAFHYTKVFDEENEKTLVQPLKTKDGMKNEKGTQHSSDSDVGNATIGLTEFAKLEKKVPLKQ